MKLKIKNVKTDLSIVHRASLNTYRLLCFLFLSFCFKTPLVGAQIWSEKFDPTNSLATYLAQIPQDVNTQNIKQAAESPSIRQEQTQTGDSDTVTTAKEVNQKLPRRDLTIPGGPSSSLARQWWQAWTTFNNRQESEEKDKTSKSKLKRIIEQIRSIEFKPPKQIEPVIVIDPVVLVEPNETSSETEAKGELEEKPTETELSYEPVTDRTLQMVGDLAQHPEQVDNPFELAEVLFFSDYPKEAVGFYQEALKRKSRDETRSDRDRPWILFQIGNCLRDDDLPMAKKMYRQLIEEHPNSPWVDLAKAREELVDWHLKDKPRTLIAESQL